MVTNVSNTGDGGSLHLRDVESLATGVVGGRTLVFAVGKDDDGLSVFELNDDGTLTNLYNLDDTGSLGIENLNEIHFVESGGNAFLIAGGEEDQLDVFSVASDGTLTQTDSQDKDDNNLLKDIDALDTITVGSKTFIVVGNAYNTSGVSVYELASDGTITETDTQADNGTLFIDEVRSIVTGEAGGNSFVIAVGYDDDGISVFQIDANGNLTNTFNLADGASPDIVGEDLELYNVRAMTTAVMGGTTYVYAGGAGDDGISVFQLNSNGTLTHVHDYEDGGVHNLDNIRSLETGTTPGGTTYMFVVGDGIDGLQIYTVGNDGSLTYFDYVADDGTQYLKDAEDITTVVVDGKLHVIAGGDENGVSVYTVPCFARGTLIDTPAGPRAVENLRAGDMVLTRDAGPQAVRFVAVRALGPRELAAHPHLRPVRIAAGSVAPGVPARDLLLSPQHRVLLEGAELSLDFGLEAALAPAASLTGHAGVTTEAAEAGITYVHIGFDRHHIVRSEGLDTESFLPGPEAIAGLDGALRAELLTLFPLLATDRLAGFEPARPILRPFETRMLAQSRRLPFAITWH